MTRELRAKWLAFATATVVVLLAALFSLLRNLPASPSLAAPAADSAKAAAPATAVGLEPARLAAGERAYARLGCAACHSISGRGHPARPLDGVGGRLDRSALREFATGTGAARAALGAGLAQRKARALDDPDLEALIDYLAQLR